MQKRRGLADLRHFSLYLFKEKQRRGRKNKMKRNQVRFFYSFNLLHQRESLKFLEGLILACCGPLELDQTSMSPLSDHLRCLAFLCNSRMSYENCSCSSQHDRANRSRSLWGRKPGRQNQWRGSEWLCTAWCLVTNTLVMSR